MLLLLDGKKGQINGCRAGEGGPRVLLHVAVGVQVSFGGCVRRAGARAGAADMPVECPGVRVVRTVLHVQCNALLVCVCRLGNAGHRVAIGHARRGARVRVRQSMEPLGSAQSPAPFGCPLMRKSRFFVAFESKSRFFLRDPI
jgi:hypothetical protein